LYSFGLRRFCFFCVDCQPWVVGPAFLGANDVGDGVDPGDAVL
jgi:hypothetical protein